MQRNAVLSTSLAAVAVAVMALVPAPARASTVVEGHVTGRALPATLSCDAPPSHFCGPGFHNDAKLRVTFDAPLDNLQSVCLDFFFEGDLLDPGDSLFMGDIGGFTNVGTEPADQRTLCVADPSTLARFADGHQRFTVVSDQPGSFRIAQVTAHAVVS